jgi:hypothetical protein
MPQKQPVPPAHSWYWEGNVQAQLIEHLKERGMTIARVANTSTREPGIDIEALTRDGVPLWMTVKGVPEDKGGTRPPTQARQWFSQAMFDVILYRQRSRTAILAVGLPDDFKTYQALAKSVRWFMTVAGATFYWVSELAGVREETYMCR